MFQARSSLKFGARFTILDTGECMKQIITYELNIFLTFSNSLKHKEQTNTDKICYKLLTLSNVASCVYLKFSKIGIQIFYMRFKIKYRPFIFEKYRIFNIDDIHIRIKRQSTFPRLRVTHNIFSLRIGQDKTGKRILTTG